MTLSASRHHKRSIALTMLFVWVFALLSGMANACLTEANGQARLHAPQHAHESDHQHVRSEMHNPDDDGAVVHAAIGHPGHDWHPDKASCQKSCEDSSQSLLKQASKPDTPHLPALAMPFQPWSDAVLVMPGSVAGVLLAAAALPPSPPPRVQFSRLAL